MDKRKHEIMAVLHGEQFTSSMDRIDGESISDTWSRAIDEATRYGARVIAIDDIMSRPMAANTVAP